MKAPTMDEWAEKLGTIALNGFEYNGRTLREWIDLMASGYCVVLPDGATNGDVIQALFDGTILMTNSMGVGYRLNPPKEGRYMPWFDKNWWNAPYKVGDTE